MIVYKLIYSQQSYHCNVKPAAFEPIFNQLRALNVLQSLLQIHTIHDMSFAVSLSLQNIYLHNNDLESLNVTMFDVNSHPPTVVIQMLKGNPLPCDENVCWLFQVFNIPPPSLPLLTQNPRYSYQLQGFLTLVLENNWMTKVCKTFPGIYCPLSVRKKDISGKLQSWYPTVCSYYELYSSLRQHFIVSGIDTLE